MKIWLKMLIAIIFGILVSIFIPEFKSFSFNNFFQFLSNVAINSLLYLTLLYVLVKAFLGFLNLKKKNLNKKIFLVFIPGIFISILFSIIVSIGFMNLNVFWPGNKFIQEGVKIDHSNSFASLILKTINENIFSSFEGSANFILPIIFIAFIFAIAAYYSNKKGIYFIESIESFDAILDKIVRQVLEFFSIGAIFIFASFVKKETFSPDNLNFIFSPLIAVILIALVVIIFYTVILYIFIKEKTRSFYLGFLGAGLIAFVTGNTVASIIPLVEHLKKNVGIKKELADTLGPIGMIINKSGTVIISTVVILSIIWIYTPNELGIMLQIAFFFLIFIFSFSLDGSSEKGFLVIVAIILSFPSLHLEQDSYLAFLISVPILSRIGTFIDTLSTAVFITITSKFANKLEDKKYINFI
ncbi:MAG: dicarboxylate/amino acid:cation symporter [Spirochaetes bacterium]|nr:dicarboxylate/amino acid:cation symporter [Spirochaetota bacterium]